MEKSNVTPFSFLVANNKSNTIEGQKSPPIVVKKDPDFTLFKLLLIGDIGVGKSSILYRFADDYFAENAPTMGVDFKVKTIDVDGSRVKLQVWDRTGQERFTTIIANSYRSTHGVLVTYDVTNRESFANVQKWLNESDRYATLDIQKMLLGNKCDLQNRVISFQDGKEFAEKFKMGFLETSAKNSINIEEAFLNIAQVIKEKKTP